MSQTLDNKLHVRYAMYHWLGEHRWVIEGASTAHCTEEGYNASWNFVQEFDLSGGDFMLLCNNQTKKEQWYDTIGRTREDACHLAFKLLRQSGQTDAAIRRGLLIEHYDVYQFVECGRAPFRMVGDAYISFRALMEVGLIVDTIAESRCLPTEILVEISQYLWQPKWSWFTTPNCWYRFYSRNKW